MSWIVGRPCGKFSRSRAFFYCCQVVGHVEKVFTLPLPNDLSVLLCVYNIHFLNFSTFIWRKNLNPTEEKYSSAHKIHNSTFTGVILYKYPPYSRCQRRSPKGPRPIGCRKVRFSLRRVKVTCAQMKPGRLFPHLRSLTSNVLFQRAPHFIQYSKFVRDCDGFPQGEEGRSRLLATS